MTIAPSVGRIVWFHPYSDQPLPMSADNVLAAIVVAVWSDTCVNLAVFDGNGNAHAFTSVLLVQPGQPKPDFGYCEWMPYQIGQALAVQPHEQALANRPPDPPGPFNEVG